MLKLVEIQIVVTTLIDHFLFFLQFSVMCWDIYWNIHVLIWASWVHPIYCDIYFVLPSAFDILRYILSCRAIAIYDLPINLRYIYKRVSPLVYRLYSWKATRGWMVGWSEISGRPYSKSTCGANKATSKVLHLLAPQRGAHRRVTYQSFWKMVERQLTNQRNGSNLGKLGESPSVFLNQVQHK